MDLVARLQGLSSPTACMDKFTVLLDNLSKEFIVGCGHDGTVSVHDAASPPTLATLKDTEPKITCLAVWPGLGMEEPRFVAGCTSGAVQVWLLKLGNALASGQLEHQSAAAEDAAAIVHIAVRGNPAATVAASGIVHVWDLPSCVVRARCAPEVVGRASNIAWLADNRIAIAHNAHGRSGLQLWDLASDSIACVGRASAGSSTITAMALLNGGRVITGADDGTLQVWATKPSVQATAFKGSHHGPVYCIDAMPDGRFVSGGRDRAVKLWNPDVVANQQPLEGTIAKHAGFVLSLACTAGSEVISADARDCTLVVTRVAPRNLHDMLNTLHQVFDAHILDCVLQRCQPDLTADDLVACITSDADRLARRWSVISANKQVFDWLTIKYAPTVKGVQQLLDSQRCTLSWATQQLMASDPGMQRAVSSHVQLPGWPANIVASWRGLAGASLDKSTNLDHITQCSLTSDQIVLEPQLPLNVSMNLIRSRGLSLTTGVDEFGQSHLSVALDTGESKQQPEPLTQQTVLQTTLSWPHCYDLTMNLENWSWSHGLCVSFAADLGCGGLQELLIQFDPAGSDTTCITVVLSEQVMSQRINARMSSVACRIDLGAGIVRILNVDDSEYNVLETSLPGLSSHSTLQLGIAFGEGLDSQETVDVSCCVTLAPGFPMASGSGRHTPADSVQAQCQLLYALLTIEQDDLAAFSAPGISGTGARALDTTVCELLDMLHDKAIKLCWPQAEGTVSPLVLAAERQLNEAVVKIACVSGPHFWLDAADGKCDLQVLSESFQAISLQVIDAVLDTLDSRIPSAISDDELVDHWTKWQRSLSTSSDPMDDRSVQPDSPSTQLMIAFKLLEAFRSSHQFAKEMAKDYFHHHQQHGSPIDRMALLLSARLYMARGRSADPPIAAQYFVAFLLHGMRNRLLSPGVPHLPTAFLARKADWDLVQQFPTNQLAATVARPPARVQRTPSAIEGPADPAPMPVQSRGVVDGWESYKQRSNRSSDAMDELMGMVGVEAAKQHALQVYKMMDAWTHLEHAARVPVTLNFTFVGNPGTGKTTVARLFGRLLHDVQARRNPRLVEVTAADLKREGVQELHRLLQVAHDGVLFIDEAYQLDPKSSAEGKEIVDALVTAAENQRDSLTIILAGYKDEIESKLYSYNIGLASRFEEVRFPDFSDSQLLEVWEYFLKKHHWQVADEAVSNVAVRRIARLRHQKSFGNARAVRSAFEAAVKVAATRWADNRSSPRQCIAMIDIVGPPPTRKTLPELDAALRDLEELAGIENVKSAVLQLVTTAAQNYKLELRGEAPLPIVLNRLMLGNPGTGKTTVAGIYGRILKSLNLISKGAVELKTASDFVGDHVGETSTKTTTILEMCRGKVLVIDEAYNLHDNMYGKQAIDTIVEKVSGAPGEDIAVLLLGYEKEMRDMLRQQNPGLARRFNPNDALMFNDYDDKTLAAIATSVCSQEGLQLSWRVLKCLVRQLARQRALPNFGNGGAVRNLLSVAKTRMMKRLSALEDAPDELRLEVSDIVGEGRNEHGAAMGDPLQPLREMHAATSILEKLEALRNRIEVARKAGRPTSGLTGNWLFMGNPGTGKTTVAKCMGTMLFDLGAIATSHVEITSAADLTGKFVGEAKTIVEAAMGRARGGVLFIDEAYQLGEGVYGTEAMVKLVELLTHESYKGTVVILAGYEADMRGMLSRNEGLASRFQAEIFFPDWTPEQSKEFVLQQMTNEGYVVGEGVAAALDSGFRALMQRPGWANARDVISAWRDRILYRRADRVTAEPEPHETITLQDVVAGMTDFLNARPQGPRRDHVTLNYFQSLAQLYDQRYDQPQFKQQPQHQRQYQHQHQEVEITEVTDADTKEEVLTAQALADRKAAAEHRALKEAEEQRSLESELRQLAQRTDAAGQVRRDEIHKRLQALREDQRAQERCKKLGLCPQSYRWDHIGNGIYRCQGGSHTLNIRTGEVGCD